MERQPPRFVPTLTEVIEPEASAAAVAEREQTPAFAPAPPAAPWVQSMPTPEVQGAAVREEATDAGQKGSERMAVPSPAEAAAPAVVDMEALVQAAVLAQVPVVMAQLQPVVEDAIRTAVLRSLGHIGAAR